MVAERVIRVEPGSELDRALSEYGAHAVVLIWRGQRVRFDEYLESPSESPGGAATSPEPAESISHEVDQYPDQ